MTLFPAVNAAYGTFFGTSPPARACVGVELTGDTRIRMEVIASRDSDLSPSSKRQALHVQGLSYWAPANIGPYSQAILVMLCEWTTMKKSHLSHIQADERVFISGQIGLIPASMAFPSPKSLAQEIALCFQHADRITRLLVASTGGDWEGHAQLVIYWLTNASGIPRIRRAHATHGKVRPSVNFHLRWQSQLWM